MSDKPKLLPLPTNLRALAIAVAPLEPALIDSGGELTDYIEEMLALRNVQLPAKLDSYDAIIRRSLSCHAEYMERARQYEAIAKGFARVVERLNENLLETMRVLDVQEVSGFEITFKKVGNPPSVSIESEDAVPDAYKTVELKTKVDKKRIAEDLKLGIPVPGARLERSHRLIAKPKRKD